MTDYKQGNPYCVQIELTEGCNLRCSFCGLNGIRAKDNNFKFMTKQTAERIASSMARNGWNSRIEFAMHGEPTWNPHMHEILAIFNHHLPKAYMLMESNGGNLQKNTVDDIVQMYQCGLTTLAFDEYTDIKLVPKIMDKLCAYYNIDLLAEDSPIIPLAGMEVSLHIYPDSGPIGNPHQRRNNKRLVWIKPIDISKGGTHASLNNHGGAGAPPNDKATGKRCAKPFREISVRWDGGVAVCCNDWRGTVPIGNVNDSDLHEDIWHSPVFYAARRKLYAGQRDFAACNGCDALSYRPGILPDHKGQVELPSPTEQDEQILAEAIAKGPMTTPVLRTWENQMDLFKKE